MVVSNVNTTY